MEARPGAMDVHALLSESDWIGGLAVRLVRDAHDAEDLAQDTRLAALRGSVRGDRSLRPWLAAAARNGARMLWRSEGSRRAVETARAAEEESEIARSPEELISTLETQELVMRFVRELPEDLSYVVIATFVEGRTPAEIANLLDVPAGTIRWRKSEALRRLRERLETHFDGDRAHWVAALVPLAQGHLRSAKATAAAAGAGSAGPLAVWFAMSATWKVATALLVSALMLVAYRAAASPMLPPDHDVEVARPAGEPVELAAAEDGRESLRAPQGTEQTPPTRTPVEAVASPGAADGRTYVRLRVVDRGGSPVAGARITPSLSIEMQRSHQHVADSLTPTALASLLSGLSRTTDENGEATWDTPLLESDGEVTFRAVGPRHGVGEAAQVVRADAADNVVEIDLVPAGSIEGRVVHTDGSTPKRQMVFVVDHQSPLLADGTDAFEWMGSDLVAASIHTDTKGRFERSGLAEGRYVAVTSALSGHDPVRSAPFDVRVGGHVDSIVLEVRPSAFGEPKVLVLDGDGKPLTTARVSLEGPHLTFTGTVDDEGEYGLATTYPDFAGGKLIVTDRSALHHPITIDPIPDDPQTLEVRMKPVPRVERTFVLVGAEGRQPGQYHARARFDEERSQSTDGKGDRFTLSLATGAANAFDLSVHARGFIATEHEGLVADELPEPYVIQLDTDPGVPGRVLVDGEPRGGVRVHVHALPFGDRVSVGGGDVSRLGGSVDSAVTDDDGRFHVFAPERGEFVLVAAGRRLADAHVELGVVDPEVSRSEVVVRMGSGGRVEGVCLTEDGEPAAGSTMMLCHPFLDSKRTRVKRDGRFAFRRVPAGDWYLRSIERSQGMVFSSLRGVPEGWEYPTNCTVVDGQTTTISFEVVDPLDTTAAGSWIHDGFDPGAWTISLSQAEGWSDDQDPFVEEHSAEAELDADGRYAIPATSRASAHLVVRAEDLKGAFRRRVPMDELAAPLDTAVGIARLRFAGTSGGDPLHVRLHVRIHWADAGWSYGQLVDRPASAETHELLVPAGLVELTWIDDDGDVRHTSTARTTAGQVLEVERP
ncbi:MAG: RNA polymerase sigma factor [Planctomycetota bacterium]